MRNEIYADYSKTFILPPSLEEWVPSTHPARFIREVVESFDLKGLGFKSRKSEEGRPSYSSNLLLKIWFYGLYNKITSTRDLENACMSHLPLIWLTGQNYPDHNTLWRFFRNNRKVIYKLFNKTVRLAIMNDLVGFYLQALDGTKIAAHVSRHHSINKQDLEQLSDMLDQSLEEVFTSVEISEDKLKHHPGHHLPKHLEDKKKLRALIKHGLSELSIDEQIELKSEVEEQLCELEENDTKHLSLTDRESRMMKNDGKKKFSYNAQAVVDSKNQVIVGASVTNEESDNHQLKTMLDKANQTTGQKAELTCGDGGYFSGEGLSAVEEAGYNVAINLGDNDKEKKSPYSKDHFIYDREHDLYVCPAKKRLLFQREKRNKKKKYVVRVYSCKEYQNCPFRDKCSKDPRGRKIERTPYDDIVNHHKELGQNDKRYREALSCRKVIVEPVFGWLKENYGFRRWNFRGLESVRAQWYMMCSLINLKKLYRMWSEGKLKFEGC